LELLARMFPEDWARRQAVAATAADAGPAVPPIPEERWVQLHAELQKAKPWLERPRREVSWRTDGDPSPGPAGSPG
jgi:hypothetical protein